MSVEGRPAPIPEYELDSIRVLVGSELKFDPCPMIREGMMVEVVHGPLRGVIGRLMRKDAQHARLVLSVDLIGQAVSVEVDAAGVEAVAVLVQGAAMDLRLVENRTFGNGVVLLRYERP